MKKFILAAALISVGLSGCGKDQDTEDYQNQQLAKDSAQIQAAQGTYSGKLISTRAGHANLGGMQIVFTPSVQYQDQTDGNKATGRPVLMANIILQNGTRMEIDTPDSLYTPNNGFFSTQIQVQQPSTVTTTGSNSLGSATTSTNTSNTTGGSSGNTSVPTTTTTTATPVSATIIIEGHVYGNTVTGTIFETTHKDYGGTFTLTKNGSDLNTLSADAVTPATDFSQLAFTGTTTFGSNQPQVQQQTRPVNVILAQPVTKPDQDFLNVLDPAKPVLMTLDYGSAVHLEMSNAQLDQSLGKLTGQLSFFSGTNAVTLNTVCSDNHQGGYNCTSTSNSSGSTALTQINPIALTSLKDTEATNDTLREPVLRTFHGTGTGFTYSNSGNAVDMTVIYPARNRADEILNLFLPESYAEITLQVSILFAPNSDASAAVSLSNGKWDVNGNELDAQQGLTTISTTLTLSCQNFNFSATTYNFTCLYTGSTLTRPVQMHFGGTSPVVSNALPSAKPKPKPKPKPHH